MFNHINALTINNGNFQLNVNQGRQEFELLSDAISPCAFYNAGHAFDFPKCHPNTREAILKRLKNWLIGLEEPNASILWLNGAAGAGKSCIARSIADWCAEEKLLLASFFFFRADSSRNNVKRFIPTLAYNITQTVPDARFIIDHALRSDPHIFSKTIDVQMRHLVLEPLARLASHQYSASMSNVQDTGLMSETHPTRGLPYVFIIDGLDECLDQAEQKAIIRLYTSILKRNIGWKILIASRPEQAIRSSFDVFVPLSLSSRIALSNEYDSDEDIRCFFEDKFAELKVAHPRKHFIPRDWPCPSEIDELVQKSSGQFIYAATVIRYISFDYDSPVNRLHSILNREPTLSTRRDLPFAELDALYTHILKNASEKLGSVKDVSLVTAVSILYVGFGGFCLIDLFREDTSIAETLSVLLGLGRGIEYVDSILGELASLITRSQSARIVIYHASLGDFIFDRSRSSYLWVDKSLLLCEIACRVISAARTSNFTVSWLIWTFLGSLIREAQLTAALSQQLSSLDMVALLNSLCFGDPILISSANFGFMVPTTFVDTLRERALDNHDWRDLYHPVVSTFDDWVARRLDQISLKGFSQRAHVAFLCSGALLEISFMGLHVQRQSYHDVEAMEIGVAFSHFWIGLFNEQLPKIRGCVLDGQRQISGIWLCIHFLVQNAVSDGIMAFASGHDRQRLKSFNYLSKKLRKKYPHHLPFTEKLALAGWKMEEEGQRRSNVDEVISAVLKGLPELLVHTLPSQPVVFALRMATSLICTQRKYDSLWQKLRVAIKRYLVVKAGLKNTRSGFGFVRVSKVYRFEGWTQFQKSRNTEFE